MSTIWQTDHCDKSTMPGRLGVRLCTFLNCALEDETAASSGRIVQGIQLQISVGQKYGKAGTDNTGQKPRRPEK
jgi:hypothetical protein